MKSGETGELVFSFCAVPCMSWSPSTCCDREGINPGAGPGFVASHTALLSRLSISAHTHTHITIEEYLCRLRPSLHVLRGRLPLGVAKSRVHSSPWTVHLWHRRSELALRTSHRSFWSRHLSQALYVLLPRLATLWGLFAADLESLLKSECIIRSDERSIAHP